MNQEKKNSIKWIATLMAIIVLFAGVGAALGLVIQQMKQNNTDTPIASGDGKNMFEGQIYEMPSVLAFSADATTAADSGHTASVTLTATVLPVEATNKLVDWSVAWGVTKQHGSENVTDYVTVTPKSDGSNIATVTCKKAFGDDEIIVTVTTREGGFTAKCQVLYVGAPTSIKVTPTGAKTITDSNWNNAKIVEIESSKTYNFNLSLDNEFGLVGSAFTPEYKISAVAYGAIKVKKDLYKSGTFQSTDYGTVDYVVQDVFESAGYIWTSFQKPGGYVDVNKFSIENGKLKVIGGSMPSSYYGISADPSRKVVESFDSYVDGKLPYVTITVTEVKTGISTTINIRTVSGVQSVSLSDSTLSF